MTSHIAEISGLVLSLATLITAIGGVALGVLNRNKLTQVHFDLNGRLTQLLTTSGAAAKAEGAQQERDRNDTH